MDDTTEMELRLRIASLEEFVQGQLDVNEKEKEAILSVYTTLRKVCQHLKLEE